MSDSSSGPTLDIKKAIQESTSEVRVADLQKKGFKQVKVLNKAVVTKLIHEAVDRVIASRSEEITQEERRRIVEQTQSRIEDISRQRSQVEGTLLEQLESARHRIAELEARANTESVKAKEAEVEELRRKLADRERQISDLQQGGGAASPVLEGLMMAIVDRFKQEQPVQGGNMSQLQASIEGLADKISRIGAVGGIGGDLSAADKEVVLERLFARDDQDTMESNVSEVKVKQAKASGVKSTLNKLKALQQGGTQDGE